MDKAIADFINEHRANSAARVEYTFNDYKIAKARHEGYSEAMDEITKMLALATQNSVSGEIYVPKGSTDCSPMPKYSNNNLGTVDIRKQ